jgi:hypothetical protein
MNTSIRGRHVGARLALSLAAAIFALLLAGSATAAELDRSVRDGWSAYAANPEPSRGGEVRDGWSSYAVRAPGEAPADSHRDGWSASAGTRPAGTSDASSLGSAVAPVPAGSGREAYVPFGTDFPKRASAQQFVPFVSDFGMEPRVPGRTVVIGPLRPVAAPAPVAEPVGGRSWADVGLGAAMGAGLAMLLALGLVGGRRLRGRAEAALADAPAGAAR